MVLFIEALIDIKTLVFQATAHIAGLTGAVITPRRIGARGQGATGCVFRAAFINVCVTQRAGIARVFTITGGALTFILGETTPLMLAGVGHARIGDDVL